PLGQRPGGVRRHPGPPPPPRPLHGPDQRGGVAGGPVEGPDRTRRPRGRPPPRRGPPLPGHRLRRRLAPPGGPPAAPAPGPAGGGRLPRRWRPGVVVAALEPPFV